LISLGDAVKGMNIKWRYDDLKKCTKKKVFDIFSRTSRLDMSHARNEPKDNLISEILEYEFGRDYFSHLEAYRESLKKTLKTLRRTKK